MRGSKLKSVHPHTTRRRQELQSAQRDQTATVALLRNDVERLDLGNALQNSSNNSEIVRAESAAEIVSIEITPRGVVDRPAELDQFLEELPYPVRLGFMTPAEP